MSIETLIRGEKKNGELSELAGRAVPVLVPSRAPSICSFPPLPLSRMMDEIDPSLGRPQWNPGPPPACWPQDRFVPQLFANGAYPPGPTNQPPGDSFVFSPLPATQPFNPPPSGTGALKREYLLRELTTSRTNLEGLQAEMQGEVNRLSTQVAALHNQTQHLQQQLSMTHQNHKNEIAALERNHDSVIHRFHASLTSLQS
jgi:hypothetical protein